MHRYGRSYEWPHFRGRDFGEKPAHFRFLRHHRGQFDRFTIIRYPREQLSQETHEEAARNFHPPFHLATSGLCSRSRNVVRESISREISASPGFLLWQRSRGVIFTNLAGTREPSHRQRAFKDARVTPRDTRCSQIAGRGVRGRGGGKGKKRRKAESSGILVFERSLSRGLTLVYSARYAFCRSSIRRCRSIYSNGKGVIPRG